MEFNWLRLTGLVTFITVDVVVAVYGRYVKGEHNRTSYSAHFAGALVGFVIGVNALKNLKTHRWEVILGWVVLVAYILFVGSAITFNIVNRDYFIDPSDPERCARIDAQFE